jgi:hypothetical protein
MQVFRATEATPFPSSPSLHARGSRVPPGAGDGTYGSLATSGPSPFSKLLRGLGVELDRGEDLAQKAIRGGRYGGNSPEKLIALQAGIYRYSEAIDLASKLVDRGTQAVRTTLQNQ